MMILGYFIAGFFTFFGWHAGEVTLSKFTKPATEQSVEHHTSLIKSTATIPIEEKKP
jgi:hypothetical protein